MRRRGTIPNQSMTYQTPGKREKDLLAIYDRLDEKIALIKTNPLGKYGGPIDQARRLKEAEDLRAEVIAELGYQPKSTLDKEIEAMRNGENIHEPAFPEGSVWSGYDPTYTGPRGGRYRINKNGRKSYDVP